VPKTVTIEVDVEGKVEVASGWGSIAYAHGLRYRV